MAKNPKEQAGPRLALLIGQSSFDGSLAPLPGVSRDVTALHLQLSNGRAGYEVSHVKLLLDATHTTFQEHIAQLCKEADALDAQSVLLYISTHGFYRDNEYHLCVRDSEVSASGPRQTVTLPQLREWLTPLAQRTQILLLDACRSHTQEQLVAKDGLGFSFSLEDALRGGSLSPTDEADGEAGAPLAINLQVPRREDLYLSGENWALLTSASAGERSWLERTGPTPFQDGPHSLFTRALLEELYAPGAGTIDVVSLHTKLQQRLKERLSRLRQGVTQTPVLLLQCQQTPVVALRASAHLEGEPFRRLASFSYDDRHHFFGRDGEIAQAIGTPEQPGGWLLGPHRHHILSAPSGAGKTSFLRAGLQPQLEAQGHLVVYVDCRIPYALWHELSDYLGHPDLNELSSLLTQCNQQNTGQEIVLLLDQCESLLLDPRLADSWMRLVRQLETLATQGTSAAYRMVFALREDCVGQWIAPPSFATTQESVLDLSDAILDTRASIDEPNETALDLSDSILDKVGGVAEETNLDMSDLILDTRAETRLEASEEVHFDLSDAILDKRPPSIQTSALSGQDEARSPSLIDILGIDSEQWHTLPFLHFHQARQAITKPLEGRSIQFDDELIFALLNDLYQQSWDDVSGRQDQMIYPPYLQIVCHTVYEEALRQGWHLVQRHHYEQMGPLSVLLGQHLKHTLEDQRGVHRLSQDAQAHAWTLLKSLVSPAGQRQVLSQKKLVQHMQRRGLKAQEIRQSFEALSQRRLITCVDVGQEPFWTLAHDFLCQLIMQEIERDPEEQQRRQAQHRLEALRDERRQALQQGQALPRLDLERATPLIAQADELELRIDEGTLAPGTWEEGEFAQVMDFVQQSVTEGQRELALQAEQKRERESLLQERERLTTQRATIVGLSLFLTLFLLLGAALTGHWALQQQERAQQQTQLAHKQKQLAQQQTQLARKQRALAAQAIAQREAALLRQEREEARVHESVGLAHSGHFRDHKASTRNKRFLKAIRFLRKSLALHKKHKNAAAEARVLFHIAYAHERINHKRTTHLQKALALYNKALRFYTRKSHPLQWAKTTHRKGFVHARFLQDRKRHLRRALALYEQAADVYHPRRHALKWASLMNDMGAAWFHLRNDPRNIPKAINAYQRALRVFDQQNTPQRWAATTHNVASAKMYLRKERAKHIKQAIALYHQVLQVRTFEKTPYPWGKTMMALGNAHLRLVHREPARFAKAHQAYTQALTVFRPHNYPHEWSKTTNNLATLYVRTARGKKHQEHFAKAVHLYKQKLDILKTTPNPKDRAGTYYNLGVAYNIRGKPIQKYYPLAIEAYHKAMSFYTPKHFPHSWRHALENQTLSWLGLYRIYRGKKRQNARTKALKGLEQVIAARQRSHMPAWSFRLRYAQLKGDPALIYKEFAAYAKQHKLSTPKHMALIEAALRLRQPKKALEWWHRLHPPKHPELMLQRLHLRWQMALLTKTNTQPALWCNKLLISYQSLRPKRLRFFDYTAAIRLVKKSDPIAATIKRSLAIFAGPFSCQRLRLIASICKQKAPACNKKKQ